jgi:nucleoside-diphosphate-sugar epimerase
MTEPRPGSSVRYHDVPVLVLGASGFIGRRVVDALVRAGAQVTAAVRDASGADRFAIGVEFTSCDLSNDVALTALLREARPAITFNLAGYGVDRNERDEDVARRINADLPRVLAERLSAITLPPWDGLRLVHVGSALEYGEAAGDLNESTTPVATTLYGSTKLAGTLAVAAVARANGLRALTARLFTVYGPGEHAGRLLPALLEVARTGEPLDLTAGR